MQIILKCKNSSGSVAFPEELVEGLPVGERRYDIVDGLVTLDGFRDEVLHHDADELLAMPGDLFRMLTPSEQKKLAQAAQQASMIEESQLTQEDAEPPALPAKKSSGG